MNQYKKKRIEAGLTQTKAARLLGTHKSTVSKWESGDSIPQTKQIPKIAALYGCTTDELLTDGGKNDAQ